MTRANKVLLVMVALTAWVPAVADARRGAHGRQKAVILQGAGFPSAAPLKCYDVYFSTVDWNWATAEYAGAIKGVCVRFGSNGVVVMHFKRGRWRVVSEGSAFRCPIPGHIPRRVQRDLKLECVPRTASERRSGYDEPAKAGRAHYRASKRDSQERVWPDLPAIDVAELAVSCTQGADDCPGSGSTVAQLPRAGTPWRPRWKQLLVLPAEAAAPEEASGFGG